MGFERKLAHSHAWKRIFFEKFTAPIHINLLAIAVWVFGSFRAKVTFDLVLREYHAFGLLRAADEARRCGVTEITAVEFGVANGAGLMNMAKIAAEVTMATGVKIRIVGFDTGKGMPEPVDYRDHPSLYRKGDYPMDTKQLRAALSAGVELVIGELKDTIGPWLQKNQANAPIGYVSLDVDYYSSSMDALKIFDGPPNSLLAVVVVYLDDIMFDEHNSACGELLAVREFSASRPKRLIERPAFIASRRVSQNAPWLKHIFFCHVLDHSARVTVGGGAPQILENPYLPRNNPNL